MHCFRRSLALFVVAVVCVGTSALAQKSYDEVDPIIGTSGGGNVFPGATLPFGMIQWSPDTGEEGWYDYGKSSIYGFSMTHLSGAGCPLFGDFPVLPWSEEPTTNPSANRSAFTLPFDHHDEQAHPGMYGLTLKNGVRVEMAVSERGGMATFRFPDGQPAALLVNASGSAHTSDSSAKGREHDGSQITLDGKDGFSATVTAGGFCSSATRYTLYIAARFDLPIERFSTWQDGAPRGGEPKAAGRQTGAWLSFGNRREVKMKVALSYVSAANARTNLDKEIPDWNQDLLRERARIVWSELLDKIAVEGGTPEQRKIFYTGLYHSLVSPTLFSDENGEYIGFDWKTHSLSGAVQKAQYANFSDWDTYRNTVQLQALLEPERTSDMMQSLVNDADQSGELPRWPAANQATYVMGGDSPAALIPSAYAFGATGFDAKSALQHAVKAATVPSGERPYLAEYRKLGYVPLPDRTSASRTLEYATDDFALAHLARAVGDDANYQMLMKQSANWKNLFDPETKWIRARATDGTWIAGFDAEKSLPKQPNAPPSGDQIGFEEGNTYQYTFMIPFDYPALLAAMGGEEEATTRLDRFFRKLICWGEPCFNMANEPDFVTPYAYAFAGKPWKTAEVITRIGKETFSTRADGIPGNDDLGATSGVYVWNALGMYPAVPGIGGVVLGTPMFDRATLRLGNGRTLVITKTGRGIYVQSASLNGKAYNSTWLPLSALRKGTTTLEMKMGNQPGKVWGTAQSDRPPAFR